MRNAALAAYASAMIEAVWLAALIVTPLFFNVYASNVFELSKVALVRTLALVMAAAWVIRYVDRAAEQPASIPLASGKAKIRSPWFRRNPLLIPALLLVAPSAASTLASVSPFISLMGSSMRAQGLLTTLAYVTIFLVTTSTMRTLGQVERSVATLLVASVPVALYAIIQHYGLDPIPWQGASGTESARVTERAVSTLGNPVFLAGHLAMTVSLALGQLQLPARLDDPYPLVKSPNRAVTAIGDQYLDVEAPAVCLRDGQRPDVTFDPAADRRVVLVDVEDPAATRLWHASNVYRLPPRLGARPTLVFLARSTLAEWDSGTPGAGTFLA